MIQIHRALKYCAIPAMAILMLCSAAFCQSAAKTGSCESLAKLSLPNTTVTLAKPLAAGEWMIPAGKNSHSGNELSVDLPSICRVQATIKTSSTSETKMELWLPASAWNQNLMTQAFPGFQGTNPQADLVDGVRRGYVALMSGGEGLGSAPATYQDPEKQIDWGYRGLHVITVAAKAMAAAFYGAPVKHAYFLGCSEGGREGFNSAHHYPEDYDGIIVSGSGNQFAKINAAQLYPAWLIAKKPERFIPEPKYAMVHDAAVAACDKLDGVIDGVIEDPRNCHFDVATLQCKGADAADCLTAPQIELLKMVYAGLINPRTKEVIFPGPAIGSEKRIFEFADIDKTFGGAWNLYKYLVFPQDGWDWKTLDMDKDIELAINKVGPFLHTTPADLKPFLDHGGKMLIWDGWNDFNSPYYWIDYYAELKKLFGAARVAESVQLYFMPGMNHCSGGEGCDAIDKVGTIANWVETGKAPERVIGAHVEKGQIIRTRPMCQYPMVDKYKGTGNSNDAANFECVVPQTVNN